MSDIRIVAAPATPARRDAGDGAYSWRLGRHRRRRLDGPVHERARLRSRTITPSRAIYVMEGTIRFRWANGWHSAEARRRFHLVPVRWCTRINASPSDMLPPSWRAAGGRTSWSMTPEAQGDDNTTNPPGRASHRHPV
jgi:hypothetical protein